VVARGALLDAGELEEDVVRVALRAVVRLVLACETAVCAVKACGALRLAKEDGAVGASVDARVACLVEVEAVLAAQTVACVRGGAGLASRITGVALVSFLD